MKESVKTASADDVKMGYREKIERKRRIGLELRDINVKLAAKCETQPRLADTQVRG